MTDKTLLTLDDNQGTSQDNRTFGFVYSIDEESDGGWFFTWMDTLSETLDSLEADEENGDGGLDECDVRCFLEEQITSVFHPEGCSCGSPDCPEWQSVQECR